MGIALVTDVEHNAVGGAIEYPMQCHRQLHHTEVGGQMAAVDRHYVNQLFADLVTELIELLCGKRLDVGGRFNF